MADEKLSYLTARLKLDYSDVEKAQRGVQQLGGEMAATANKGAKPLDDAVKKVGLSARDLKSVGRDLTIGVTLPIVAAGAAALKLSGDFDTTFGQMVSLAGVAASEVDGLKDSVLDLAGETAQAPNDLAKALYFIRSAGIDGADAMEALDSSARAAAAGLGTAESVADAITSAMNAYGPSVLSASEATDILVASVREGKAEASAFAPQLGRLLPIAATLGVGFDQVAGALAFLSRTSGDAAQSATQVQGIMQQLIAPTGDAAKALESVGLSGEQVRKAIKERGLIEALRLLDARFNGNSEALRKVFGDIQGFTGALALVNAPAAELDGVMKSVAESTGATGAAFEAASDTGAFQMRQALAEVQVALIQVGDVLLPLAADVAQFAGTLVSAFDALPQPVKTATLAFLGVVAAAGPVISIGVKLRDAFGLAEKAMTSLGGSSSKLGGAFALLGPAGIAVAGAAALGFIAFQDLAKAKAEVKQRAEELTGALEVETGALGDNLKAAQAARFEGVADDLAKLGATYDDVTKAVGANTVEFAGFLSRAQQTTGATSKLVKALIQEREALTQSAAATINNAVASGKLNVEQVKGIVAQTQTAEVVTELAAAMADGSLSVDELGTANANLLPLLEAIRKATADQAGAADDAAGSTDDLAGATGEAGEAAKKAVAQVHDLTGNLDDAKQAADGFRSSLDLLTGGQLDLEDSAIRWNVAMAEVGSALKDNGQTLDINTEKGRANREAVLGGVQAALDYAGALVGSGKSAQEARGFLDLYVAGLKNQLRQFGLTEGEAQAYIDTLGLTPETLDTAVQLAGDADAKRRVEELLASYKNLPDEVATEIRAAIDAGDYARAQKLLDDLAKSRTATIFIKEERRTSTGNVPLKTGGPVPGPRDAPVPITAHGGEFVLSADVVDAIKRGGKTLGLGTRQALGAGVASASAGAALVAGATKITNVYATGSPVMVDEARLVELFARAEALYA
jgi:TP901 family phage tail tape measure protein